jgi:hypothetical protein
MKTYESKTPRAAIAFAAAAMTALTLSLSVIAPASIETGPSSAATVVAAQAAGQPATQPAATPRAAI